jgi:ribosomal protein L34
MDYHVSSKQEQRGILAGMLLGVAKKDQNNFLVKHPSSQAEYINFKAQLLELITRKLVHVRYQRTLQGKTQIVIQPRQIPLIRVMVQRLYHQSQKVITTQFLNYLTPQGIAIWYMDQGSKSYKKKDNRIHGFEVRLNTQTSHSENEAIVNYFAEHWGFKWGLAKSQKGYCLRMGTQEGKRFFEFISPHIHPSLLNKIQPSYNSNGHHLRSNNAHGEGIVQRVRKLAQI